MRQKLFAAFVVAVTAAYCWGLGWIAWGFIRAGGVIGWGLASGVVLFLVLTVWATWREILFGMRSTALLRRYETEGADHPLPEPRAEFEAARTAAEAAPQDWRIRMRLALAYDANRDRRHAREHMRRAIALAASAPEPGPTRPGSAPAERP